MMMRYLTQIYVVIGVLSLCISNILSAQTVDRSRSTGEAPSEVEQIQVEKISDSVFKLGLITIDKANESISIPAKVNQREGLIELLLCTEWGRTHESAFTTNVYPVYLQTAMLVLGFKYGAPVAFAGESKTPTGDPVEIYVTWRDGSEKARIEDFAYDQPKKSSMEHVSWVYTGSQFVNGVFYSQEEGSIITTYHDPNTMFDNPLPEGADDTVYYINADLMKNVPEFVTIIFAKPRQVTEGGDL
ncbi:MAG: YdjY domain-containing protein [Candidatus Auribacterota bacterium]|jgi:hypothetical protein|nr:YdjY domain-containing protein [Candidatus Auribacterota bacterium]